MPSSGPKNAKAREKTEKRPRAGATPLGEWLEEKDHVARRHDIWDLLEWYTRIVAPEIAKRHSLWHRFLRFIGVEERMQTPWELLRARAEAIARQEEERARLEQAEDELGGDR